MESYTFKSTSRITFLWSSSTAYTWSTNDGLAGEKEITCAYISSSGSVSTCQEVKQFYY